MTKSIRVNEYYDLFDVYLHPGDSLVTDIRDLPSEVIPTNEYNGFRGFSNWPNFDDNNKTLTTPPNTYTLNSTIEITGKHKSPQALNTVRIDDNGDIYCYPPNVSVPYWSRLIFRNFDYSISNSDWVKANIDNIFVKNFELKGKGENEPILVDPTSHESYNLPSQITIKATENDANPENPYIYNGQPVTAGQEMTFVLWNTNTYEYKWNNEFPENYPEIYQQVYSGITGYNYDSTITGTSIDYSTVPLFLRFDEYQSRSKVIFSGVDKTRNPDIEFNFGYKKGQMEPIKLNLSLSAGIPLRESNRNKYNQNLSKAQIESLLSSCYWCVEWICDLDAGN